jgi:hypothetical protein
METENDSWTPKLKKDGTPDLRSVRGRKRFVDPEVRKKLWEGKLKAAEENPRAMGGRPRKPTREEAREHALEELWPKAYRRLMDILDDPDATPAQIIQVGKLLWEQKFGKASQAPEDNGHVTAIEYITTAMETRESDLRVEG